MNPSPQKEDYAEIVSTLRKNYTATRRAPSYEWRIQQLKQLERMFIGSL
jgi:hypothetical protein